MRHLPLKIALLLTSLAAVLLAIYALDADGAAIDQPASAAPEAPARESSEPARRAGSPRHRTATEPAAAADHRRREQLALRVGSMTLEQALAELPLYADGRRPDHARWLFQVSGLLMQHPTACDAFVEAALSPESRARAQVMVADILAAVGHPRAQRALQRLVEQTDHDTAVQHRLIQSHLQVGAPDAETAEWLVDRLDHPTLGPAATVAIGSVAGRLTPGDRAAELVDRLADGLERAHDPQRRRAHLLGLANAGPISDRATPAVIAQLDDAEPRVRQAAAAALAHVDNGAGREALYRALDDAEAPVQRQAMASLGKMGLLDDDIEPLLVRLSAGRLTPAAQTALLQAAAEAPTEAALALLSGLTEHATVARVRERARVALTRRASDPG